MIASSVCIGLTLRYMYWRILFTLPGHQGFFQSIWSHLFLTVELGTLTSSILVYFFMSRTINRSSDADSCQNSALTSCPPTSSSRLITSPRHPRTDHRWRTLDRPRGSPGVDPR